jgi:hypothetical protein
MGAWQVGEFVVELFSIPWRWGVEHINCQLGRGHHGEPIKIGSHEVWAGGFQLGSDCLGEIDTLVSLSNEQPDLTDYPNVEHLKFIIVDFGIDAGLKGFLETEVTPRLEQRKILAFHCMFGIGRTGTALAALIALLEPDTVDPIAVLRKRYCPQAVETLTQAKFVFDCAGRPLSAIHSRRYW